MSDHLKTLAKYFTIVFHGCLCYFFAIISEIYSRYEKQDTGLHRQLV